MLYFILDGSDYVSIVQNKYIWIEDILKRRILILDLDTCKVLYSEGYKSNKIVMLVEYAICNKILFSKYSCLCKDRGSKNNIIEMCGFYVQLNKDAYPFISYTVYWCNNKVSFIILSDGSIESKGKIPDSILSIIKENIKYLEFYWIGVFNHILYEDRGTLNVRVCGIR